MWTLTNKPKTSQVTKSLAKEYAEMDPAPHDRALSERRLQVYQVNGKHTSIMLSGLDKMPEFYVTTEEYECETLEDVARLYATFDSKMMSRTTGDINKSFAATVPALRDLPGTTVNISVPGMSFHTWGPSGWGSHQPAERAELLLEHSDFVLWVAEILNVGTSNGRGDNEGRRSCVHLRRMPVVAAMFGSWQKAKRESTEFWTAVRDETGTSPKMPDRRLARFLTQYSMTRAGGYAGKVKVAGDREFYVKCIKFWNNWRSGEDTEVLYRPDSEIPKIK